MATKRKKSQPQTAYEKEIGRIKNFIANAESRGFSFPNYVLPKTLKTARKHSAKVLYTKARYYDYLTKQTITGTERMHQIRSSASKKGWETRRTRKKQGAQYAIEYEPKDIPNITDKVLLTIEDMIVSWSPSPNWSDWYKDYRNGLRNAMQNMLWGAIRDEGRTNVAKRLEDSSAEVIQIAETILLTSDDRENLEMQLTRFSAILKGRPLTVMESLEITGWQEVEEDYDMPF